MHILSNEELRRIYPESDGKPMAENTLQFEWIALIKLNLEACFAAQADVFIAADLFWYPVEGKGSIRMAPDVMVALGRPKGHRGSYLQFLEGDIPPQVVFEILSPGNRKAEMSRKLKFYSDYGVKEYYIYNPHKNHLEIYTRTRNELRLRDEVFRWTSPLLGIQFVWTTENLTLYTPNGDPFLSYLELTDFHKQAIDALKESRALLQQEKKLLQLEIKRAQQETQRANEEAQRANEEAQRADLAEQRLKTSINTLAQAGVPRSEIVQLLGLSKVEIEKYLEQIAKFNAMPTLNEVMQLLQAYNSPSTKNTLMNHGAREPFYGVKVGDLKTIIKELKLKKEYQLALDLYNTGNSDAMYLAGLIVDEKKISKDDLRHWVKGAYWHMLHDYTVAWVAAESPYGLELGLEWIESPEETTASAGWATLSYWAQLRPNAELDLPLYQKLLERVQKNIHQAPNRVRYTMNGFMIMVGSQFPELTEHCIEMSESLGTIYVDMGGTSCKVPDAGEYIYKVQEKGTIGKKKKMVRC